MSEADERDDTTRSIPTAHLIGLPGHWIDEFTDHCEQVKTVRLLFARGRAEPTPPPELADFHIRLQDMPRPDGQGVLQAFDVDGFQLCQGPRALCEFLWTEGQEHYRAVCLDAERDEVAVPRRLRIVAKCLDGKGAEVCELGGYTGINPQRGAKKRGAARGLNFVEDNVEEPGPSYASTRINQSLEKGYLKLLTRVEQGLDKRAQDIDNFAKVTYERAEEYHAKVSSKEEDGDMDDEIMLAGLGLASQIFGEKQKRNEKADDINAKAPKDGKPGGPACAYARQALSHFDEQIIANCRERLGAQPVDRMIQTLRMATEPSCDDKTILKKFKQSAEWFLAQYQRDPNSLMCIPRDAAVPLDALLKLSMA